MIEDREEHVIEAIGRCRILIRDGKVVEVGPPLIRECPLAKRFARPVHPITPEAVKENIEHRIRSFGMCTVDRQVLSSGEYVGFGATEIISFGLSAGIHDAAVGRGLCGFEAIRLDVGSLHAARHVHRQRTVMYCDGNVTVAGTGAPVVGATVQAIGTVRTFEASADAAGHFSMTLPVGTYTVNISGLRLHAGEHPGRRDRREFDNTAQRRPRFGAKLHGLRQSLGRCRGLGALRQDHHRRLPRCADLD